MARTKDAAGPGLRERKKARTRQLIQSHALRLFRQQGYKETSVEQIAEAAEVSPSTVFHYFPTKVDLVKYDAMDEQMVEAMREVPADVGLLDAMRQAMWQTFVNAAGDDLDAALERERLMRTVPELRAALLEEFTRTIRLMTGILAERSGRPADDEQLQALAGAVIGIGLAAWSATDGHFMAESFLERLDKGMVWLAAGFDI